MAMQKFTRTLASVFVCGAALVTVAAENPFIGQWELTIPGGAAGWLGVEEKGGKLQANIMWGAGSVEPVTSATMKGNQLLLTRTYEIERTTAGKKRKVKHTDQISAVLHGDKMDLMLTPIPDEKGGEPPRGSGFTGHRQPPMPRTPDLSKVKFGPPINLFNGTDLTGWRLTDPKAVNGWHVEDGLLVNNPAQDEGKPHKNYGNLRTDQEFEDFNINVMVRVGKDQNSGVYLRGIYEVQVADTYGHGVDPHNMGAVYSRITPTEAAEKPPGEWQTLDITLVDRHVTVVFNGKRIIDNKPVMGCTGGALWSDVSRPGPIYLQGDHTGITYKSLILKPVIK
jgi:hypothetical protein